MNIKDRIKNIQGVRDCKYDWQSMTLSVLYCPSVITLGSLQIRVSKTISDIQLQNSIRRIVFQNGGKLVEQPPKEGDAR